MKNIQFSRIDKAKFFRTLNKRVNTYFKDNDLKRTCARILAKRINQETTSS